MMSRILVFCLLATALAYATSEDVEVASTRDIVQCDPKPGDAILVDMDIADAGHYAGKVDFFVTYPASGSPQVKFINCIKVYVDAELGGTAAITEGGVGLKNVTFHFESSFTKAAAFSVIIMGH